MGFRVEDIRHLLSRRQEPTSAPTPKWNFKLSLGGVQEGRRVEEKERETGRKGGMVEETALSWRRGRGRRIRGERNGGEKRSCEDKG